GVEWFDLHSQPNASVPVEQLSQPLFNRAYGNSMIQHTESKKQRFKGTWQPVGTALILCPFVPLC
ncbi:MAG TPA: hypothetical protein PLK30_25990, partial [Blastocatellia bacterium]|nr:hypothetical protein [Blastocatellia bacterium]